MKDDFEEVNIHEFCRICFEHKPNLVSCQQMLILEDFTCTTKEILSLLSSQQFAELPTYPSNICFTCNELVGGAFALKVMYEKTSEVLKNLFISSEIKGKCELNKNDYLIETNSQLTTLQKQDEYLSEEGTDTSNAILESKQSFDTEYWNLNNDITVDERKVLYNKLETDLENRQNVLLQTNCDKEIVWTLDKEIQETLKISKVKFTKPKKVLHLCPICFIEISNPLEFRKHVQSHKVLKKYLKGKPVSKKSRFVAKPRNTISIFNIPEAKHWCPYCDEYFPALKFGIHLRNHSLTDEFHCRKCDRVFAKLKDYSLHKTVVHREEYPYNCEYCNVGFVSKRNFDCHVLKHTTNEEDLPYACEKCPKKFTSSKNLKAHQQVHGGKGYPNALKQYRCSVCYEYFHTENFYVQHIKNCDSANQRNRRQAKRFRCELCDKPFRTRIFLSRHIRITHEKRKKICEICGKAVFHVAIHMRSHFGKRDKPMMCDMCGKVFRSVQSYGRHYRIKHSGYEPYLCEVCGKSFRYYQSFKSHEKGHIGNKSCVVEKSYLKARLTTHVK